MKPVLILLALLMISCKKDAPVTLDGTYHVMSSNHFPGQIDISGNNIQFSGMGFGNYSSTIARYDMEFIINPGQFIRLGDGRVHDDHISGQVQISHNSGVSKFTFEGTRQ